MKATIELPDDLYRQVKARSAAEGRTVKETTIRLYEEWLDAPLASGKPGRVEELAAVYAATDRSFKTSSGRRTARDLLNDDRNRLEKS